MDDGAVPRESVLQKLEHPVVTVDDYNIGIAEVTVIPVDKLIVSSGNSVRADAVAGEDGILHAIVADEQMPLALLDLAAGIVEQVINVKL